MPSYFCDLRTINVIDLTCTLQRLIHEFIKTPGGEESQKISISRKNFNGVIANPIESSLAVSSPGHRVDG